MKLTNKNIPKYTPYLSNRWDRMDEYHTLDSEKVSEKDFATWWAVVFKRGKVQTLEDAISLPKYSLNNITRSDDSSYYGSWEVDLYGGMFHCLGMYPSTDFYMDYLPDDIFRKYYKTPAWTDKSSTRQERFDFIMELIQKYYPNESETN